MLLGIFFAALCVRGLFIFTLQDGYYFPDSVIYSDAAISLLTTGSLGNSYDRPPGYAVFLSGIFFLFGESILAIRIVEGVIGGLLAVVIAIIARRIGGATVGMLAGFLWSIYPIAVFITGLQYPTNLLTALLACGLIAFLPYPDQRPSLTRVFLTGVLWGLAALTIPIVLATVAAVSIWLIYWGGIDHSRHALVLVLGTALLVVPWMVRDFYVYDRLVIVEPRVVAHLPRMRSANKSDRNEAIKMIRQYPGDYAHRVARVFLYFWTLYPERLTMDEPRYRESVHEQNPRIVPNTIFAANNLVKAVSILTTGPLFLFAIVGTAWMWFQPESRRYLSLLWSIILSFAVGYSLFHAKLRYRIPIEPYIVILCAYGLSTTWRAVVIRCTARGTVAAPGSLETSKQA